MTLVSYSQNFEDVVLWRALRDVESGSYLDIGAQDPIVDSVSLAFYQAGWRGIHVEPTPAYAARLREERPDEMVIEAAVTDTPGPVAFYEIPETGLSTGDADIAGRHGEIGFEVRRIVVPCVRLDQLLELAGDDLHWLKIDVEGMEADVLRSWGDSPRRPWILVIEATLPNTQVPSFELWIDEVLKRGYREAYFDGLSRYFLSDDHAELAERFAAPPNIFDGFQLTSRHFAIQQYAREAGDQISEAGRRTEGLQSELSSVSAQLATASADIDQARTQRAVADQRAGVLEEQLTALSDDADRARNGQLAAMEALAIARQEHCVAIDQAWRERHAFEVGLREQWTVTEGEYRQAEVARAIELRIVGARVAAIDERAADENERLSTALAQLEHKVAQLQTTAAGIEALIIAAVAPPPSAWHRLGRSLGISRKSGERPALSSRPQQADPAVQNLEPDPYMPINIEARNPYLRAESLDELLAWQDVNFVRCAYVTLLGRQPDRTGEAYYTDRIRRGHSKMEVLGQLRRSAEGRLHDPGIAGLDRALNKARWRSIPVVGSVVGLFTNGAEDRSSQMHRSIETQPRIEHDVQTTADNVGLPVSGVQPAKTVDELLSFHDEDFVRLAYASLLGRTVDADGLAHFLARVRNGIDRRQILAELWRSSEGRNHKAQIAGLEAAIRPFPRRRWIPSPLIGSRSAEDQRRHVRSMINELHRIEARHGERLAQVEAGHGERLDQIEAKLQEVVAKAGRLLPPGGLNRRNAIARIKDDSRKRALRASEPRSTLPRLIYYFVDHTILCPVNTGMQRLVRQLGRCLIDEGEVVRFVKWSAETKSFVLVSQAELDHLAQWNGPAIPEADRYLYTEEGGGELMPAADQDLWLLVPEVTHVTYQQQAPTLDAIMAAKTLGAKVAFVYYDAIPLRLPEYEAGAAAHEKYMQSLLLADVLIPISRRSAAEVQEFFVQYQCAATIPQIEALHLPGESTLSPRAVTPRREVSEKIILAVGSIEPRKNQLELIEAFDQFSVTPEGQDWRLVLAGHLRGDVAARVYAAIERNDRISYIPHPLDAELDQLYRSADFTVFPSVEEGFGLPILESLWYGIPCICANFGAMAEVAEGGGCLTIDTRSVAEIRGALSHLAARPGLLANLSAQAVSRPMTTWKDYARSVGAVLTRVADRTSHLHVVYFWVDDTCRNSHNSGIQRVVRQLARALIAQGYTLIPVKWDDGRLSPLTEHDLAHLEKWNGPLRGQWGDWVDPEDSPPLSWLIIPELVHGHLGVVRNYAHSAGMRCAAIFYDAIPYRMKEVFGAVFSGHHATYMLELAKFDKIFSISRYSHHDLKDFLRARRVRNNSFDHRFEVVSNLGPLVEHPRVASVKSADGAIHILSVISIEPRKNPLALLRAFAKAAEESSREIRLTVVGRRIPSFDSMAAEVEAFAEETPGFAWLQDIDDAHLARLYAEADFTVFPSLEEGFGLPIIESLWHGRPCLVHEAGAMAEIAEGGGCVSVDMRDSDLLADAIVSLANDDRGRAALAEAAIRRPVATWDDYARDMMRSISLDRLDEGVEPVAPAEAGDIRQELVNLKKRPTLSVCISTYNRGAWLGVNLRNLFSQIPEPMAEIEFLVVDNASEDNTEEVVKPYLHRPDFRFLRNPENVGMLGNLTVTAHEARGEYIWILGDDDLVKDNGILRVLEVISANPGVALIYPNYAYTHEKDPENVGDDIQKFLDACPCVTEACSDLSATVKDIAAKNENLFTAIYCLILRRDHALRAYSQDTSGRAFSTMRTSIPTTYYVLNYMMGEPAYWIGDLLLVVNFNVSWDKYAALQILERVPEAQDLAERLGADSKEMDRWRENLLPGFVHYWREMLENDMHGNAEFFSPERVVMRMKHLDSFAAIVPAMAEIYDQAFANEHRAANLPTANLFSAFY